MRFPPRRGSEPGLGSEPRLFLARTATTIARAIGLIAVVITVLTSGHRPGLAGRGLVVTVALGISALAWLAWMLASSRPWRPSHRPRLATASLIALAASGGILAAACPDSGAIAVSVVSAMAAAASLPLESGIGVTAEAVAAYLLASTVAGTAPGLRLGFSITVIGGWTAGLTRRANIMRAEQAERLLDQTRRAAAAEAEAAALAERTRIARDIHDVLAHSLAAVSVTLEAASGLLTELAAGPGAPGGPERLGQVTACVDRAAQLTRDGLAEARHAILALREDATPLTERLAGLVSGHRADGDAAASLTVTGSPRPVPAEAGQALYRGAQEALTNARKHAPGQPVTVLLDYAAGTVSLTITNPLAGEGPVSSGQEPPGPGQPLTQAGGGYGLTGMRERAGRAGGIATAAAEEGKWRVCLTIPA